MSKRKREDNCGPDRVGDDKKVEEEFVVVSKKRRKMKSETEKKVKEKVEWGREVMKRMEDGLREQDYTVEIFSRQELLTALKETLDFIGNHVHLDDIHRDDACLLANLVKSLVFFLKLIDKRIDDRINDSFPKPDSFKLATIVQRRNTELAWRAIQELEKKEKIEMIEEEKKKSKKNVKSRSTRGKKKGDEKKACKSSKSKKKKK